MQEKDLKAELKALDAQAEELSISEGKKVHNYSWIGQGEVIKLFVYEPSRMMKVRIFDMAQKGGIMEATMQMLPEIILKKESDSRITSEVENAENDLVFMSALASLQSLISIHVGALKKN